MRSDTGGMTEQKAKPVLLSGGNPQIAKGEGDGPVQVYIAAMPDWKHDIGCMLDRLIVEAVPEVHKAVKWNTPFYGIAGEGWFLGLHCLTKYVKVSFFQGRTSSPSRRASRSRGMSAISTSTRCVIEIARS